jgi:hypothetical protein
MAKKARKKLEEDEAATSFEFPEFDEERFIAHEYEQTLATALAVVVAVALAVLSFSIDRLLLPLGQPSLEGFVPLIVGILLIVASPFFLQRLRRGAPTYTRGDWASVILVELFGWLGVWFLLTDVLFR